MYNSVIQQGTFISDGVSPVTIKLRSDVDWMKVYNYTQAAGTTITNGFEYYWQRGMGTQGIMHYHPAADATMASAATAVGAFTLIDSSAQTLGAAIALTNSTNATRPVINTGSTVGLSTGAIVRMFTTGVGLQTDLNGLDFTVDAVTLNTNFRLANTLATAPGAAPTTGTWRLVAHNLDEYKLFHPAVRNIANVTQAVTPTVTTLVDHGLVAGQRIKFAIPHIVYGMTQLNGLTATVLTTPTAGTFTIDVDTTAFTAFAFPTIANVTTYGAFTQAQVIPFGETATSTYANKLDDAVYNKSFLGMILAAGVQAPAGGTNADVIYWVAGKSENL
jgi:hypothetical protein